MHCLSVVEVNAKATKNVVTTKSARTTNVEPPAPTNVASTPFAVPKTTWLPVRVRQAIRETRLPGVTQTRAVLVEVEFTITTTRNEKYQRDNKIDMVSKKRIDLGKSLNQWTFAVIKKRNVLWDT